MSDSLWVKENSDCRWFIRPAHCKTGFGMGHGSRRCYHIVAKNIKTGKEIFIHSDSYTVQDARAIIQNNWGGGKLFPISC
jgi:hypothetical protein